MAGLANAGGGTRFSVRYNLDKALGTESNALLIEYVKTSKDPFVIKTSNGGNFSFTYDDLLVENISSYPHFEFGADTVPDDATVVLESCPIPAEFEIKSITSKQTGTGAKTGVNQYQLDIDITLKGSSPIAPLKDSSLEVVFTSGSTEYTKNGESQNSDAAPYIASDGRTMVPLRFVAEALGAEVNWSSESRTATIELTGKTLNIQVDQQLPNDLGVAVISSDRLFVPVRYVSEELGAVVDWDEETQTITIKFS